ncbi:MAG: methyltransferase domain-containing protein [Candidatus Thorarchaeota archaeon]
MAVAFMAALEKTPESYDKEFDDVLDGRASKIRNRILEMVESGMKVLDLGCGPGAFAIEASKKGADVVAMDADAGMIQVARERSSVLQKPPEFIYGDILQLGEFSDYEISNARRESDFDTTILPKGEYDLVVSTFLLSELKPHQRQLFMHIVMTVLKDGGSFAFASEVLPEDKSEVKRFWKNRSIAEKEARRRFPPPIADLQSLIKDSGLEIAQENHYGPEILLAIGYRGKSIGTNQYQNRILKFHGARARARIWYNHITGGWRGIPIKPGLYKAGNPTQESPVVVTANYELTYYTVMRALAKDKVDAWVLVCDTAGINVWCAARGIHFETEDVVQMIRVTRLSEFVSHREILLPQLAAAGINPTEIRERTGFRARYGPVKIQDLARWLELGKPRPKPREMAIVTFNLRERMEQTVAHIPFLYAAILAKPILAILVITLFGSLGALVIFPAFFNEIISTAFSVLLLIGEFNLALFGNAFILGVFFPVLPAKGNSFWRRGIALALGTLPFAALLMYMLQSHWTTFITWMIIQFVMATSLTMDWSGMTSVSDPKVIRREYPYMVTMLKVGGALVVIFNLIMIFLGW